MGYRHGTQWSDELIKSKVLEVKENLGLDRMPSHKECDEYFGNYTLSNAITKKKGWYKLAAEMGLPVKKSETLLGKTHESKVFELLQSKGFAVQQMPQNFLYDLLVDGCVKIDVKASHLYNGKNGDFYSFRLGKPFATCDIYALVALGERDEINRIMIVPSKFVMENMQISVGATNSVYHRFTDRWDYIEELSRYWTKVV